MKHTVTAEDVYAVAPGGELAVPLGAVVTPWAREVAASRGVRLTAAASGGPPNVVAVGCDHGGLAVKEQVKAILARLGWGIQDVGTQSTEAVDYPDFALAVARAVQDRKARLGIMVDGAGIGSAMAANKVPGVRAALVVNAAAARNAREHNDANVMTLGAGYVAADALPAIVETFLSTECTEPRHRRRVDKIVAIESAHLKGKARE